ncbi:MAG: AIPR family protein [Bacteroidales bacterium]|nr:AIPR family protein [Bacteroidales bacterium]MCF8336700.1 AIPR family protein [Bacteroidales bacterium]
MHRIIKSHLESFAKSNGLEQFNESTQFEMFVNYAVMSSKMIGTIEVENITTGEGDDGTDGIGILINEELILSEEDAKSVFSTDKKSHDVEVIFIQSKRSESFDLGDFLKFKESINNFLTSESYNPNDEVQKNYRGIFDVIIENVPKIRNGKPSFTARYATTGLYKKPSEIEAAKNEFIKQLEELGYFDHLDFQFLGRDEITNLWVSTYSGVNSKLSMFSNAPLPSISGIEEAYLAVVKAKDFVNELLTNEDGNLRSHVFEENVRAFLGEENPVNTEISKTIKDPNNSSRFPVLNNGITIVSEDVRVQGSILHLQNFQIVNGCQTSNVLFENSNNLENDLMVNLKVVETSNEDVFSELVRATNSQTKVDETQFLSLRPIVKRIEAYFNTYEGKDGRIYFERRDRQYIGTDIPSIRIFSLNIAAKAVCAMFLERPDLSFRYPKRMYELFTEKLFSEDVKEITYYTACLTLYRLHLLVASADIPQNMRKYKWHLLLIVRNILAGGSVPEINSKKIENYCQNIIDAFAKHGDSVKEPFNKAVEIIQSIDEITDDRLKRQTIMDEMLQKI